MILSDGAPALRYELDGEGHRPLVFIHGVGSYLEAFDRVIPPLLPDFRILRYDQRGHGRSEKIRGRYQIEDLADDLRRLLDHVGFERFDLVGFSLGGLVAQYAALAWPERVRRLVLLSTVAGRNADEKARVATRLAALVAGVAGGHYDSSVGRWFTEAFQAANPGLMAELRARNAANDPECYAAAYRVLAETDFGDRLHEIAAPTLIVTGSEDQGSNPRMARLMAERIPAARLEILPGLRHSLPNEVPDVLARLIGDFLHEEDTHGRGLA